MVKAVLNPSLAQLSSWDTLLPVPEQPMSIPHSELPSSQATSPETNLMAMTESANEKASFPECLADVVLSSDIQFLLGLNVGLGLSLFKKTSRWTIILPHELGHYAAARLLGRPATLHFSPMANHIQTELRPVFWEYLVVCGAGPLVNFGIAALLPYAVYEYANASFAWGAIAPLSLLHAIYGALNLRPGLEESGGKKFPTDGARILMAWRGEV